MTIIWRHTNQLSSSMASWQCTRSAFFIFLFFYLLFVAWGNSNLNFQRHLEGFIDCVYM